MHLTILFYPGGQRFSQGLSSSLASRSFARVSSKGCRKLSLHILPTKHNFIQILECVPTGLATFDCLMCELAEIGIAHPAQLLSPPIASLRLFFTFHCCCCCCLHSQEISSVPADEAGSISPRIACLTRSRISQPSWLCGDTKLHQSFVCWTPKTHSHHKGSAHSVLASGQVYKPSESQKAAVLQHLLCRYTGVHLLCSRSCRGEVSGREKTRVDSLLFDEP